MKPKSKFLNLLASSLLAAVSTANAQTTWSGGGSDDNWSTSANWTSGLPAENAVVFANDDATGTTGPLGTANNIVDANTTITSLKFTNLDTTGYHTTSIPADVTLAVNGGGTNIEVQSPTTGTTDVVYATILGDGTLSANNTGATLYVGQGAASANSTRRATLDMSGLEQFSATLSQIVVGRQPNSNFPTRPQGTLKLARNNTLNLSGNPGIVIGNIASNSGTGQAQVMELGTTNTILSNNGITIGGRKGSGYFRFNSATVTPGAGSAMFRDLAGTGRQATWIIGDNSQQTGNPSGSLSIGVVDFSTYGEVDALVDVMILGRATGEASITGFTQGTLTFDSGTINTNSLTAGIQPASSTKSGNARGTVNVNGTATLLVNGDVTLGRDIGEATYNAEGILNIGTGSGGGELEVRGNVICGGGTGNKITVRNGGTLKLGGTLGRPDTSDTVLETLDLSGSTLVFNFGSSPNPTEPRAQVASLLAAGTVDLKVTGTNLTPGTIKLIEYTTLGGDGFPALNLLPTIGITASLVDNAAGNSIDLVITEVATLKWTGTPGGDWDLATSANWLTVPGNTSSTYDEIDGVGFATAFDDTATGTKSVNLTTTLSPQSVLVDTNATYTFTGSGSLSGAGNILKQGTGTLILDTITTHTGPTTINVGTLQIGNGGTTGSLSLASPLTNDATLAFNRSDTVTQGTDFVPTLGGTGGLTQLGSGTLVLTGANTYTGPTTVSQGVLQVGDGTTDSGTLGSNSQSNVLIAPGAELRINRTAQFGYDYRGELSGSGTVTVMPGKRMNFRINQPNSGDLAFDVNGILAANTGDGVTLVEIGELSGSGVIQRGGPAPSSPPPTVLSIGGKNTSSTYSGVITNIGEFAVDKVGTGTLTLTGTYSHGGTTTVSSGTLALGASATIPNSSAFIIAAGAVLDTSARTTFTMAATQPFTVAVDPAGDGACGSLTAQELVITDAVMAINPAATLDDPVYVLATYTSLTGAAFASVTGVPSGYELDYDYQGDKIALVAGGSSGFASWQAANGTTGGLADDHDNDGVDNGVEYFLGGPNGNTTGFTALPGVTDTAGTLSITWTKGSGYAGEYDTHFHVETSDTLSGTWTPETEGVTVSLTGDNVTYTFPTPLGTRKFARLVVTGP